MASIKKAQKGKKVVDSVPSEMFPGKNVAVKDIRRGPYITEKKKTVVKKKMKDGGKSFPDLNKDGKITKADILKGRGVIKNGAKVAKKAKAGASVKKKAMGGMKMMKGGGKCKYGC